MPRKMSSRRLSASSLLFGSPAARTTVAATMETDRAPVKFAVIGDALVDITVGASSRFRPDRSSRSVVIVLSARTSPPRRLRPRASPPPPLPSHSSHSSPLSLLSPLSGPLDEMPVAGADVEVDAVTHHPGGSALNTAWHLAAQGVPATLHAAVGKDRAARLLTSALEDESRVSNPAETLAVLKYQATATCVAMHGARMERSFVSAYGAAKLATLAQLLPDGPDALDATHVHIGGFYVCRGIQSGLANVVRRLKARGVRVSMDPNFDATGEWSTSAARAAIRGDAAVHLLMPSEVEACEMTGKNTAEAALEDLVGSDGKGVELAVIKRGAAGVLAGDASGARWSAPACTVSRVADTNGAGDAFNAGFLRVWASGGDVGAALRAGCAAAAIAAQHHGGAGAWAPDAGAVDAQANAEYGDKPWWQQGVLACMAPRRLT